MKKLVETGERISLTDREYLRILEFLSERLKITQSRIDNQKITISIEIFPASRVGTPEYEIFMTGEIKPPFRLSEQLLALLQGFGYELPHQTQDATPGFPSDSEEKEQVE